MKAEKPEAENLSPKAGVWCCGDLKWNGWQCWGFSQNLDLTAIIHCDTYSLEGL